MIFHELPVAGARRIEIEPRADARGFFARAWCAQEFAAAGLVAEIVQASLAYSVAGGTLRGMHFQAAPHGEAKVVRCVRGAAYVVALDLRPDSSTWLRWAGVELSAENRTALYVPVGCAQGYQTLVDDTEMLYQMSEVYAPSAARGVRYNDPAFGIQWPLAVKSISPADESWPDFAPEQFEPLQRGKPAPPASSLHTSKA